MPDAGNLGNPVEERGDLVPVEGRPLHRISRSMSSSRLLRFSSSSSTGCGCRYAGTLITDLGNTAPRYSARSLDLIAQPFHEVRDAWLTAPITKYAAKRRISS